MRKELRHHNVDDIKKHVHATFAGLKFDIVLKCWGLGYGDMHLDWHCGEYTQITQSVIESPDFPKMVNEVIRHAELLWAAGQACIRVVCVCDQGTRGPTSIAVASPLQAVFEQAGYNSKGPIRVREVVG